MTMPQRVTEPETIRGTVHRVRFHNQSNGYCVLSVDTGDDYITAVGYMPSIREGDEFTFTGRWVEHPKFGRQFAFDACELVLPQSRQGIIAYLSTLAYGVGPVRAARIVDALGENCLETIIQQPELLYQVPGISPEQAGEIIDGLKRNTALAELAALICRQGVTPRLAAKIYAHYGPDSIKVVKENPYVLADEIFGVGFHTADRIAQAVGIAPDSPCRVEAAVEYVLGSAQGEGHCYLRPRDIVPAVQKLLGRGCGVGVDEIAAACNALIEKARLIREENAIYPADLHRAECYLATRMSGLVGRQADIDQNDLERALNFAEQAAGIEYAPQQRAAIETALTNHLSIITGGPGTGKSTVTNGIIAAYKKLYPFNPVYLASPTGRAAKRLSEVTGQEAKTIHRLLKYHPEIGFQVDENNPLHAPGLLIVDEFSMTDIKLAADLFAAVPDNMQVVLVGDVDQLPSVGPGSVLRDAISSGVVPTVRLKFNYRQAQGSQIAACADMVRRGVVPPLASLNKDVECIFVGGADQVIQVVTDRVRQALSDGYGPMDFQVLTPVYKGPAGVDALNEAIRELVNPPARAKTEHKFNGKTFRLGDKVMVVKNDYPKGVFNGDIGKVTGIVSDGENQGVWVRFEEEVFFPAEDLDRLTLAYACTVHKSQGSEFPLCIVVCVKSHYIMLQRNLLYTAITRAKHRLVLVCQPEAVEIAVRNDRIQERYSRLKERLVGLNGD
ncbi:SF1B family DNA helicase RecD2 [Desulfovirgula thermocuniculi]|uniref:SF1B family DNA helicase RecD2 n=1 Tax=Desulfovirgula thermocuniculi TaxID=348842 RepID=UPI0003FCA30B|nr:ATP-dependent RecD-like DNA helicase [Desulfovirgula thermocuniculi]